MTNPDSVEQTSWTVRSMATRALREAVLTMLAMLATLACAMAIDAEPGPAVLAVVLCLSFSRSHLDRDLRGRLEAAVTLPVVGLVATGVGMLLLHLPWIGAAVFVTGMFLSIWLRRFGAMAQRAGSLIALPFVVILTTPYIPSQHANPVLVVLIPVIVALLALLWVAAFHALGRRLGMLPPMNAFAVKPLAEMPQQSSLRPIASTRMAIQMAVALAASFVIGYLFFAERWAWIVLTAFIVNSGNRGRLDVAYKSVLRVMGAGAGTLLALSVTLHVGAHDSTTVVLILAAVFLGMWLRPLGYAWWALFVTIALALLQGFEGETASRVLSLRLEEILIGALIGVASAWWVYPVRSIAVLRRRIADVLAILADAFDPATPARNSDEVLHALVRMDQLDAAFRASRLLTRHFRSVHPADWVDAVWSCHAAACTLIQQQRTPPDVRRAIGAARKALRQPETLLAALQHAQQVLKKAARESSPRPALPDTTADDSPHTELR